MAKWRNAVACRLNARAAPLRNKRARRDDADALSSIIFWHLLPVARGSGLRGWPAAPINHRAAKQQQRLHAAPHHNSSSQLSSIAERKPPIGVSIDCQRASKSWPAGKSTIIMATMTTLQGSIDSRRNQHTMADELAGRSASRQ